MIEKGDITLPGHERVLVRALTGADEEWLLGLAGSTRQAGLVTEVLARCVEQLGAHPATRELVRDLGVGDRDFLLLKLRELSFGAKLWRVVTCPAAGCGAKMDLELGADELPVDARPAQASHTVRVDDLEVEFRVPRGREQELVASLPAAAPERLRARLLEACVIAVRQDGEERPFAALSAPGQEAVAAAIEQAAAGVGLEVGLTCPECGHGFDVELDPMALLLEEVGGGLAALERELHLLAFHYHWPLAELLALTRPRRQRFLRLLGEQLGAKS